MALIAEWTLNGNSNESVASRNGTDTSISYVTWYTGQCASLNGTTSFIDVTDNNVFSFTSKIWTWNCWFKTSQTTHWQFISKGNTSNFEWSFYIGQAGSGRVGWEMWTSAGSSLWKWDTTSWYNDNNWHMATIVFNNAQPVIYIDWVAVAMSGSGAGWTSTNGTSNVNMWRRADWNQYYSWSLEEVRLYDTAFSASEVTALYNSYRNNPNFFMFF